MNKYTDKYINNFDILKNAVIGYEFEFFTTRPYFKLLELLNRELAPIKIAGYRVYHSSGEVGKDKWKLEPDTSLGADGCEIITEPLPYVNAKVYLLKMLKILQSKEFRTDDKCSLHINISFDREKSPKLLDNLNHLKLILNMDENLVYKYFPKRENNFYAKTIKKLIPFKNFQFSSNASELLTNNLELPDTKYYGVNMLNVYNGKDGRLEFRYIGDKDYQFKTGEILDLMDYFIMLTWNCIDESLDENDVEQLKEYLADNINQFKNFTKYDNFVSEFPSISLQVDKSAEPIIVKVYYEQFYNELYDIITNIYNLNNCVINFDTETQRLEIVDASFKVIFDLKKLSFIESIIDSGSFMNCTFAECEIKNAHLNGCVVQASEVYSCKVENSKIMDDSVLKDCYLYNSYLDAKMEGGVFRSGKLGENAEIGKDVKVVTSQNNYFGKDDGESSKAKISDIELLKGLTSGISKKKFLKGNKNINQTPTF